MSVGERLREERQRLGVSQERLAKIAGVAKNTAINWEKDASSPTATALIAFGEAGADVLYILTGRRPPDRPENAVTQIEDQLEGIRLDMLQPTRHRLPGEDDQRAEERETKSVKSALKAMLRYDADFLTAEMREEVEHLLDIVEDPLKLAMYRAAEHVQMRKRREETRAKFHFYFGDGPYEPGEAVTYLLTTMALNYPVPVKLLVELVEEIHRDITEHSDAKAG